MTTRLIRIALLVALWTALWSDVSTANLATGTVLATTIVLTFDTWRAGSPAIRPIRAAKFAVYFTYKLVESSLRVARTVVTPRHRIRPGIVAVPLRGCSDALATLIADAISLTPGTLTLDVRGDPPTLYIHALDMRDIESIRRDVRRLEVLAISAFGTTAAIAGLTIDDTRTESPT